MVVRRNGPGATETRRSAPSGRRLSPLWWATNLGQRCQSRSRHSHCHPRCARPTAARGSLLALGHPLVGFRCPLDGAFAVTTNRPFPSRARYRRIWSCRSVSSRSSSPGCFCGREKKQTGCLFFLVFFCGEESVNLLSGEL